MEWTEARALKPSILSEMAVKTNSQVLNNDDDSYLVEMNSVSSDDFPVEDLLNLDFPEVEGCFYREDEEKFDLERDSNHFSFKSSGADEFCTISSGELPDPIDDLENMEWLSQFDDDSTAGLSLNCPAGYFTKNSGVHHDIRIEQVSSPVPKKARSKRSRQPGWLWYLASPPLSTAESSSITLTRTAQEQKREPETNGPVSGLKCSHCQVQKTPQWRTGPLGPKTLCNACGVRFKSGRLLPEYRPARSPTFSNGMHSNSHRKVLEMRLKREMSQGCRTRFGLTVKS